MKLLFDQNISFRITKGISDIFPNSKQVKQLNLDDSSDIDIWRYARKNDYVIVTFDADFSDIVNVNGCPPKIIWLRTGNMTTNAIIKSLKLHKLIIEEFIESSEYEKIACLEIG